MLLHAPVRQFMTPDPAAVGLGASLSELRRLLRDRPFHHVPVTDDAGRVVGMLSAYDLARISLDAWVPHEETVDEEIDLVFDVSDVMTPEPVTVDASAPLRAAAELLATGRYHALPVTEGGRLVGVLTTTDLIRHMLAG